MGIKELNLWTCSDMNGKYIIKNIPAGAYTMQASCLGFEIYSQSFTVPVTGQYIIKMVTTSLALDEVVVVAKEGKKITSTTTINASTLEHIQPSDLTDIMQLIPGGVSVNPDLSGTKQLAIREIISSNNSVDQMASLGTQLLIDGAPVSNDANMQVSSTISAPFGKLTSSYSSSATGGVDTRNISVDNIESVEVVRGIASAEQGDALSGVVKVNLKKGYTPLTAKVKVDPNIKQFYIGKGTRLPKGRGALNFDFDIIKSLDDARFPYKTFYRLNGSVTYSNTFFKQSRPLNVNITTNCYDGRDVEETDPDQLAIENYKSSDKSLGMTISGKWSLNSKFITSLNYNFSGNIQHQLSKVTDAVTLNGQEPYYNSFVDDEYELYLYPSVFISKYSIDGRPYYFNGKVIGIKTNHILKSGMNNFKVGVEYKISGNNGNGRRYTSEWPPVGYDRPRSYKDIPAMDQVALFSEEEMTIPLGSTKLDLQVGVRYTNIKPSSVFNSSVNTTTLEPRVNVKYQVIDKKPNLLSKFALRFGYGLFSKAPVLLYYYPDKAYFDQISFQHNVSSPGNYYNFNVGTTVVFNDTRDYNLKAAKNRKLEVGVDFTLAGIDVMVTGYAEKMTNGFKFTNSYHPIVYNKYDTVDDLIGKDFTYTPGIGVSYTDILTGEQVAVPSKKDTVWFDYSYPTNSQRVLKSGIEFSIDFGSVKPIRTSLYLDGAYMKVKRQDMADYLWQPNTAYDSKTIPYVGLYPGGEGTINQRFSTNLRSVTHIKELRMVLTLTFQSIWYEKEQNIYEDKNGHPLLYTKVPVDNVYEDKTQAKYKCPYGYYDYNLNYYTFDPSLATAKPLVDLLTSGTTYYYAPVKYPFIYQINLKLTKEITSYANLSFYVNNITNYRPLQKLGINNYSRARNDKIYFGAELKIKI